MKRQINQGFFTKLLIYQDGTVERAELTEPFAQLLAPNWHATVQGDQNAQTHPRRLPMRKTLDGNPITPGRPGTAERAGQHHRWWYNGKPRQDHCRGWFA